MGHAAYCLQCSTALRLNQQLVGEDREAATKLAKPGLAPRWAPGMQLGCTTWLAQDSQVVSKCAQRGGGRVLGAVLRWGTHVPFCTAETRACTLSDHTSLQILGFLILLRSGQRPACLVWSKEEKAEEQTMEKLLGRSPVPKHHVFQQRVERAALPGCLGI